MMAHLCHLKYLISSISPSVHMGLLDVSIDTKDLEWKPKTLVEEEGMQRNGGELSTVMAINKQALTTTYQNKKPHNFVSATNVGTGDA